jgi:SpoVK/Ycf46/Vps4 family AAA+-type ATPase
VPVAGEALTRNTPVPVDRETSAALADIIFPGDIQPAAPLFNATVTEAVATIVEEWAHFDALAEIDIRPSKTCLIYGAPGTGKTTLAFWLARELGLPAVVARLDGLVSSFLGTTARNVGNLFSFANRYRCVLILDEFDAVAKVRDDPHEVGEIKRVVNALLQSIDGRREAGITLAITNHETLLDPAIWRRFELQLHVPRPSLDARAEILRRYLGGMEVGTNVEKLVAWLTDGMSGAEIEMLARALIKQAVLSEREGPVSLACIQQAVEMTGARISNERRTSLHQDPPRLARDLAGARELSLTQAEIGQLFGRDKATIGRWLKAAI